MRVTAQRMRTPPISRLPGYFSVRHGSAICVHNFSQNHAATASPGSRLGWHRAEPQRDGHKSQAESDRRASHRVTSEGLALVFSLPSLRRSSMPSPVGNTASHTGPRVSTWAEAIAGAKSGNSGCQIENRPVTTAFRLFSGGTKIVKCSAKSFGRSFPCWGWWPTLPCRCGGRWRRQFPSAS